MVPTFFRVGEPSQPKKGEKGHLAGGPSQCRLAEVEHLNKYRCSALKEGRVSGEILWLRLHIQEAKAQGVLPAKVVDQCLGTSRILVCGVFIPTVGRPVSSLRLVPRLRGICFLDVPCRFFPFFPPFWRKTNKKQHEHETLLHKVNGGNFEATSHSSNSFSANCPGSPANSCCQPKGDVINNPSGHVLPQRVRNFK